MRKKSCKIIPAMALLATFGSMAQERQVDPTFLYRDSARVEAASSDITADHCRYKPLFGQGDRDHAALVGIERYGEAVVDSGGT